MNVRLPMATNSYQKPGPSGRFSGKLGSTSVPVRLLGILILLTLPMLACGSVNPGSRVNNNVRLAVYNYEQEVRGKTDDLVLDFERSEPRLVFAGQNEDGGRTVWLYRLGAGEFFALRPPERSYLYIQSIKYHNDNSANVTVFRGDGSGYQGRELTLEKDNEQWRVILDKEVQPGIVE